jgi:hypothetical protein
LPGCGVLAMAWIKYWIRSCRTSEIFLQKVAAFFSLPGWQTHVFATVPFLEIRFFLALFKFAGTLNSGLVDSA